jgi:hypothetical protein
MDGQRGTVQARNVPARYLERNERPFGERLLEFWFAPKPFESTKLCERLGVRFLKRYVPTGGDYFIQRIGVRIVDIQDNIVSLVHFEQLTRVHEALHVFFFVFFVTYSLRRWLSGQTTLLSFLFALVVYVLLILPPVELQRYNRIRAYRAIRLLTMKYRKAKLLR